MNIIFKKYCQKMCQINNCKNKYFRTSSRVFLAYMIAFKR